MAASKTFSIDTLWAIERLGPPSLSPDGAQAVASLTRYSMEDNSSRTSLWLLSTLGGDPRRLTQAGDKDASPRWSPQGDQIAFLARREQDGRKDDTAQLYLIPPDGGEARRVSDVPMGIEAFKWFPDGRHIAFVAWVWPQLKGAAAQARAWAAWQARKTSGYVTSEALYRYWDHHIPMDRVPHLHVLDTRTGKVRDLFEGSDWELSRSEPDADCFDISPDGRRIVFACDPAPHKQLDHCFALAEVEVRSRQVRLLLQEAGWHLHAPVYSHAGHHLAFLACHRGHKHTMPDQLGVLDTHGHWAVLSEDWDREVQAPLRWDEDDLGVLFCGEDEGRRHLWRFDVKTCAAFTQFEGGNATAFDLQAGTLVVLHDSAAHPPRLSVVDDVTDSARAQRIETFNDALLRPLRTGRVEAVQLRGAQGDDVQMWLTYPPGFDAKRKYPLLHLIHGGPHAAFGDSWHFRWNAQLLAAEGYVVACVNYHGSSGFGFAFKDAITHRWGELELQDVEAATDWLLRKPWIARDRVFASGGSYGGYMVAWMNGHVKTGRYQAYVCHAGCYDWQAMFADDAYTWHSKELGACYWNDPARVAAQSPHAFAQHMQTPTLVIHGAQDYRVPDAQGLAYYNTLKARGVDARLLWFPDENHWVLKPQNSRLWYQEFLVWLAAHDPGRRAVKRPRQTSAARR